MAVLGTGASGNKRPSRRGADSWDNQPNVGLGYLLGLVGGAVAVAAFVGAALTFGWVDHLQNRWRHLNVKGTVSNLAAQGDDKVTNLGGVVGNITGAVSNQRSFSEGRLQDANRAVGDAAGAQVPAARR
jgi:hypothetical protein